MTLHTSGAISLDQIRAENQAPYPISFFDHRRGAYTSLNNTGFPGVTAGVPDSHVGMNFAQFYKLHKVIDGMAEWGGAGSWAFTIPQSGYIEILTCGAGGGGAVGRRNGTTGESGGQGGLSQVTGTKHDFDGTAWPLVLTALGGRAGSRLGNGGVANESYDLQFVPVYLGDLSPGGEGGSQSDPQGIGGRGGHTTTGTFPNYGARYRFGTGGDPATTGTGGSGGNWGAGGGGTRGGGGGSGANVVQAAGYSVWPGYCPAIPISITNGANGARGSTSDANAGMGGAAYTRVIWKAQRPW